jgi:hypothetical protein
VIYREFTENMVSAGTVVCEAGLSLSIERFFPDFSMNGFKSAAIKPRIGETHR